MSKRLMIKKLALPAAIIAAACIIFLVGSIPVYNAQFENHKEEFKKYINSFMDQNTKYLKGIASRIRSERPDPVLVSELQSEYMTDHQKSDQPKKYLWMSSLNGDFVFGVPSEDFQKVNSAFDKYQDRIKADEFYRDRNDFLTRLIDKSGRIDFTQFERAERPERWGEENSWRFYKGDEEGGLMQPAVTIFSTPVYDANGRLAGKLFMKVDDRVNEEKYYSEWKFERSDLRDALRIIPTVLLVFSGIFLWFLLPTWVYVDAQERDVKNPGIWAFFTLISLFFGLTIYLITRPNTLKSSTCPECQGELNGTRAYCPLCGYDLSNNYCQQCQYPIKPEWKFCPECRAEIKGTGDKGKWEEEKIGKEEVDRRHGTGDKEQGKEDRSDGKEVSAGQVDI